MNTNAIPLLAISQDTPTEVLAAVTRLLDSETALNLSRLLDSPCAEYLHRDSKAAVVATIRSIFEPMIPQ